MKFRKKPVVVEAIQLTPKTFDACLKFIGVFCEQPCKHTCTFYIKTLEGNLTAMHGDWIIKGVNGEFYPCKPDIFEKTYEKVEEI
jgi:hypothetical protein